MTGVCYGGGGGGGVGRGAFVLVIYIAGHLCQPALRDPFLLSVFVCVVRVFRSL